ncbi:MULTISPECIES: lipid II-degrading bacteriocin [Enterobacter cloacae complex]|uniref:lipid II-degrading bacteriocin n=1 Tax=Enterobacter cloacae complex TaxID=354276 RepID=UPI0018686472|nr:lipid II-degrading bacteriocin [Enterobacter cloacae complex sp. P23RS]MBE3165222.1 lipid II-degrading bacteriocin [Enterobacter cloacae complex sp. P23RS]HAV1970624.1 lipid II-degrading bacteriocin [Enterobacter hormaechei subsp. steigerwaltii]
MANEETMVVEAVPTWPSTYNYSILTTPYKGMPSPQERVRRAQAYQDGTMTALKLEQCLKDPNNMKEILCAAAYAEELRAKGGNGHNLYQADFLNAPKIFDPNKQTELTDGAFAPLAALYHYTFGDGTPMRVELSKLNFNFSRETLPPVNTILNTIHIGQFNINQDFGYDFKNSSYWAWSYLGRVSLNLRGTLNVDRTGAWSFDGKVLGFVDRYDANSDPKRGKVGQLLTDVLRAIPGHTEYDIYLSGEHQIKLSGKK